MTVRIRVSAVRALPPRRTQARPPCGRSGIAGHRGLRILGVATARVATLLLGLAWTPAAESGDQKTLIPPLRLGDDSFFEVYGQINKGFLVYDDGGGALFYPLVDNSNSSTRFGARAGAPVEGDFRFGANFEFEWTPYATSTVNRANRDDPDFAMDQTTLLRKFEAWVESPTYGKLSVGQGSMASDSTAEVDLSGTDVVAYSLVGDLAGGQFLRTGGASSTVQVKDAFGNLDGLSRLMRARYDTPSFAGFSAAASLGTKIVRDVVGDTNWDVTLRYAQRLGDFKVQGAVAYSRAGDNDQDRADGSLSVRHASGWNGTFAAGWETSESTSADAGFLYGKLGYAARILDAGETAFSVDHYRGQDFAADGSDSQSFGAAVVQRLDHYGTELFVGARLYDYSQPGDHFENGWGILTGARIRF